MALTSGALSNLLGGVSQQPSILRHPTQLEDQTNFITSLVEGLSKRPPVEHVAYLGASTITDPDAFIHFIDRAADERYLVSIIGTTVKVWDIIDGVDRTVTPTAAATAYLTTAISPRESLRAVTVADYTFIVNKEITTSKVSACTTAATGSLTFTGQPSDGNFVTINDGVFELAFEFDNNAAATILGTQLITIGATKEDTAQTLTDAINSPEHASVFHVKASLAGAVVTLTNNQMGQSGNVAIAKTAANINKVDFSGGVGGTHSVRSNTGRQGYSVSVAVPANDTEYSISASGYGQIADFTSSASGVVKSSTIRADLVSDVSAFGSKFSAGSASGETFAITRPASITAATSSDPENVRTIQSMPLDVTVQSTNTIKGLLLTGNSVQSFTDLPVKGRRAQKIKVTGDPGSQFDDYYVQAVATSGQALRDADITGDVIWIETVAPNILYNIDQTTMPISLVRESDGNFTLDVIDWDARGCGDETTNPWPTFIDHKITDVFFFKDRLGFVSGENVVLSQVGNYFNFFRATVTTLLDTDPVDVTVSVNKVANLHHAVLAGKRLFVLSENFQFELTGSPLTPASGELVLTASYAADPSIYPVVGNDNVFFVFPRGPDYSGIRQLLPSDNNDDLFTDVTSHVPYLLGGGITSMAYSSSNDLLFVLPGGMGQRTLYVYKEHWADGPNGKERQVSAWAKWTFFEDTLAITVIDQYLYLLFHNETIADRAYLGRIDLRDGIVDTGLDWRVLLDQQLAGDNDDVTFTQTTDAVYTMPFYWTEADTPMVCIDMTTFEEVPFHDANGSNRKVTFQNETHDAAFQANLLFGLTYPASITFSTPILRKSDSAGHSVAVPDESLYLLFWSVNYGNTGYLQAEVTRPDGAIRNYYGKDNWVDGAIPLTGGRAAGLLKFPIRIETHTPYTIKILNSTHKPVNLVNAGWEGNFVVRNR